MHALLTAARLYADAPAGTSFEEDLAAFVQHAHVRSSAEAFAMAKPVALARLRAGEPVRVAEQQDFVDCWYIWLAAGDLGRLITLLPFPLPWIAFRRGSKTGDRVHAYALHRFTNKIL